MRIGLKLTELDAVFYEKLLCKKFVLGQPNGQEAFSNQATEVKKFIPFLITILKTQ